MHDQSQRFCDVPLNWSVSESDVARTTSVSILMKHVDFEKGERDNADVVLLKDKFFANSIQVEPIADELTRQILRARNNKDCSVVKALSEMRKDWEESEE